MYMYNQMCIRIGNEYMLDHNALFKIDVAA